MWLCAVWYTTTLLGFRHCTLYPNCDFAHLSHTQELEWKKMRSWPCTGSGEMQKTPQTQLLPWEIAFSWGKATVMREGEELAVL